MSARMATSAYGDGTTPQVLLALAHQQCQVKFESDQE